MEKYFTIGEAAKEARATAETLRHYDRIGLVHPSKRERETGYRYYTQDDIVRLHTVRALQQMDLPLKKIQEILREDDLNAVVAFLEEAERKAEEKIALFSEYDRAMDLALSMAYERQNILKLKEVFEVDSREKKLAV